MQVVVLLLSGLFFSMFSNFDQLDIDSVQQNVVCCISQSSIRGSHV